MLAPQRELIQVTYRAQSAILSTPPQRELIQHLNVLKETKTQCEPNQIQK